MLYYGGKLIANDKLGGGVLVSFVFYMQSLFATFSSLGNIYVGLVQAVGAADKVQAAGVRRSRDLSSDALTVTFFSSPACRCSCKQVYEWVRRAPKSTVPPEGSGLVPGRCEGRLELRDVTFAYPQRPNRPVLNRLSLSVAAGRVLALCGPSGGGKSSIMALLQTWYTETRALLLAVT